MSSMVKKRITQETFDETVVENMDEFDMTRDEALTDAVEQFRSQGIDLSSVDCSGSEERRLEREELSAALKTVEAASGGGVATDAITDALDHLATACTGEPKKRAKANRAAVLMQGGLDALSALMRACVDGEKIANLQVAVATAKALRASVGNEAESRDASRRSRCVEAALIATTAGLNRGEETLLLAGLELTTTLCTRCEENKTSFYKAKGGVLLIKALEHSQKSKAPIVRAICETMCSITMADDVRSPTSCTFDVSKALTTGGAVAALVEAGRTFFALVVAGESGDTITALGSVLDAMRQLAKSDDCVQRLNKAKVLGICCGLLERRTLEVQVIGLLRNMASNDDAKDDMCNRGRTLEELCLAMARLAQNQALVEHGLATLAQMALRRPSNARKIALENSGVDLIVGSMQFHVGSDIQSINLQRQGCLALRNIVARSEGELIQPVLAAGAEAVLRAAGAAHPNVDVAFAALRDLGIDAKIQTFQADETASNGVRVVEKETYGGGAAANFRAIFDESVDVAKEIAKQDELVDQQTKIANMALM